MRHLRRTLSVIGLIPMLSCAATASEALSRSRTFELTYRATVRAIPEGAKVLDLWLPLPRTDRNQTIHRLTIDAPGPVTIGREPEYGNPCLHTRLEAPKAPVAVTLTIEATRRENAGGEPDLSDRERSLSLREEPLIPLGGPIRQLALEASGGLPTDILKARAVYEKVVGMMRYDKGGTGWGRGDALFACDAKRGNCTDFHALVIGMARSVGIPARFSIGLPLPEERGSGEIPGYHCWAELFVDGRGWVPVDASEASKRPTRRDYFFGHHDENRLEFSRGRHLRLVPPQQGPPLNFFIDPYAEVDGRPHPSIDRTFQFRDAGGANRSSSRRETAPPSPTLRAPSPSRDEDRGAGGEAGEGRIRISLPLPGLATHHSILATPPSPALRAPSPGGRG